jgi:ATPase subunit of ABC transporter with duplicated ATPase domains
VELRQERMLTQARVYDKQMDRIRQEQNFIDKYRAGQRARQAKGREARLERFKRDEVMERPMELEVMNLKLPKAPRSGDQIVVAENISKAYGDKVLFKDLSITIMRGERIGIIGPNGAGKTTLVRCLLGELPVDSGDIRTGSRLSIGYYKQLHDHLDMSLRIWQYLQTVITANDGSAVPRKGSEQLARDLAGAFLYSGDEQEKVLSQLSGGERSRAVLAGLMAASHNVLVLDEPTNHLDIPSAERLEQALTMGEDGYEGTLMLITHDRQLLQDTCTKLIVLDGEGGSRVFDGSYGDWERRQREEAAALKSEPKRAAKPQAAAVMVAKPVTSAKKEKTTGIAALSMEKLEAQIQKLQTSMQSIDNQLGDPAVYADGSNMRRLQSDRAHLERELEPLEQEWARRADQA